MGSNKLQSFEDGNFDAEVLKASTPVVVDFWAPWCAPCKAMEPSIEELSASYEGKVKFGKVNTDENPGVVERFGVRSMPTLILFKDGQAIAQLVGGVPKRKIEDMVKQGL
ncbi:MAG: thioredoxin [Myxococcota bacterium]